MNMHLVCSLASLSLPIKVIDIQYMYGTNNKIMVNLDHPLDILYILALHETWLKNETKSAVIVESTGIEKQGYGSWKYLK